MKFFHQKHILAELFTRRSKLTVKNILLIILKYKNLLDFLKFDYSENGLWFIIPRDVR